MPFGEIVDKPDSPALAELDPCSRVGLSNYPPLTGRSNDPSKSGVDGYHCDTGAGVTGTSRGGNGIVGEGKTAGVVGKSEAGIGVSAASHSYEAIHAESKAPKVAAVAVYNTNPQGTGAALFAKKEGTEGHAGFFDGNVWIVRDLGVSGNIAMATGSITCGKGDVILSSADCAEDFDISAAEAVEPGTVMVLGEDGALHPSDLAYDSHVAGVISGAGDYKPGIVLDRQQSERTRQPIALLGKVYCKADAQHGPIAAGDLLTTSPTPGHAMKVDDPLRAFGATIGKALRPLKEGQGLIPILIVLR